MRWSILSDKFQFIKGFFETEIAFDRYMGLRVEEVSEGRALCCLPFKEQFVGDPWRPALHGGVTSMLVDVCAGIAALSTLPLGSRCSTVDMRVDYLRPAGPRDLWARSEVLRTGSQVAVVDVAVFQKSEGGEPQQVALGRAAFSLKAKFAEGLTPHSSEAIQAQIL